MHPMQEDRDKASDLLRQDKTWSVTLNQLESRVIAERLECPLGTCGVFRQMSVVVLDFMSGKCNSL